MEKRQQQPFRVVEAPLHLLRDSNHPILDGEFLRVTQTFAVNYRSVRVSPQEFSNHLEWDSNPSIVVLGRWYG
jgi:hypothetical protein